MSSLDQRGLSHSSTHRTSIEGYDRALALLQGYFGNPLAIIDEVLAEDPEFVSGLALRAGLFVVSSEKRAVPELRSTVLRAEALADKGVANPREQAHIAAARAWLDGDFARATDLYNRIALEYPRDALAIQISHLCNFLLGRATWLRDHSAAALGEHAPGEAMHGYLHGMLAFGLEECGEYALAEQAGRRAVELNPRDTWAIHAVAHCFEMNGRAFEGIEWLRHREPDWAPDNFFAIHNHWHLALFFLEVGDREGALQLYDERVRGTSSETNMDLVDASALLWRLELAGLDVRERWLELAQVHRRVEEEGYYSFNDWHALMAYAGAGAQADVERVLEGLQRTAANASGWNARIAEEVGQPVCRAFASFAAHDYAAAVNLLLGVRPFAGRFGGSHAQRDVLETTLIEAALRSKQYALAAGLLRARRARKPHSPAPRLRALRMQLGGGPESERSRAAAVAFGS